VPFKGRGGQKKLIWERTGTIRGLERAPCSGRMLSKKKRILQKEGYGSEAKRSKMGEGKASYSL